MRNVARVWSAGPAGISKNKATTQCQPGCRINGVFYASGAVNATQCQSCQPAVSTTAWSDLGNGSSRNDHNACTQSDSCQAGTCVGGNPVVCGAADQCHTAGHVRPRSRALLQPHKADGTRLQRRQRLHPERRLRGRRLHRRRWARVTCPAADQCHPAGTATRAPACARTRQAQRHGLQRRQRLHEGDDLPGRRLRRRHAGGCARPSTSATRPGRVQPGHGRVLEPNGGQRHHLRQRLRIRNRDV